MDSLGIDQANYQSDYQSNYQANYQAVEGKEGTNTVKHRV